MAEYAASVDEREGLFEFGGFKGLRNNVDAEDFSPEDLTTALNVDINDALAFSRRMGYSAPVAAGIDRDLWASGSVCLGVGSNALKQMMPDYSLVTLRSGLTADRPLAYAAVGDRVFWSNGVQTGCVQAGADRTWGITPPGMVVASAGPGALPAGLYQCVVTYLRSDGQESGAPRATTIELTAESGISLSSIPVSADAGVTHKAVYCTSVGGGILYRVGVILNATTTFAILEPQKDASPLLTQFLQPAPACDFMGYWNGTLLAAKGNRLYPSEPYAPELFDIRKSVPFLGNITMIAPVTGGVWVGTDSQILWLDGAATEKWTYREAADYGVIPGCLACADSDTIGDGRGAGERIALFASKRGFCAGDARGSLSNLTESRYAYPAMDRGAGIVRRHRGMVQYLVSLKGTETAGNVAA